MSLPRSLSTPGVLTQLSGNGKVLRRPNRPGSLKISGGQGQASLNRLSSMSSMSSLEMSGLEDLVVTMENVARHLVNRNYSLVVLSALNGLYSSLHQCGMQLDTLYKDQLDKLMVFRCILVVLLYKCNSFPPSPYSGPPLETRSWSLCPGFRSSTSSS